IKRQRFERSLTVNFLQPITQRNVRRRERKMMRGRAHNLFFRTERARAFEMRQHGAENFRRGVREQALAQSFSQESAHERLSFVMRLNLLECGTRETFKALTSEIHAV